MKFWRNNWEKRLGARLRNAEVQPESYVWGLLEGELNARADRRRAATRRRAGMAALLLLITASSLVYLSRPQARQFAGAGRLALTTPLNTYAGPANAAGVIVHSNRSADGQAGTGFRAGRSAQQPDFTGGEIMVPASASRPGIASLAGMDDRPLLGSLSVQERLREPSIRLRSGKRELMRRLAAQAAVPGDLLVMRSSRQVVAAVQTHNITALSGRTLSVPWSFQPELAGRTTPARTAQPDTDLAVAAVESSETAAAWYADADEELASWKQSLDSAETPQSVEPLTDQALLDEAEEHERTWNRNKELQRTHAMNRGFHLGVVGGFQGTWVRPASRNPEVDRSAVEHRFAPGYQAGINLGYDINDHFGLMAEFKFSDEGGKYYNPLKDRQEHLDLKYLELPVYAKIKHSKITSNSRLLVFNYLAGVRYSDLRVVSATLDGDTEQRFGQDYSTSKWGFSGGFELDYYIRGNFFLTVGVRGGITGNAKSFPRLEGEEGHGAIGYDAGVFTRLSYRFSGR